MYLNRVKVTQIERAVLMVNVRHLIVTNEVRLVWCSCAKLRELIKLLFEVMSGGAEGWVY